MEKSLFHSLSSDLNLHDPADWLTFKSRLEVAIGSGDARRIEKTRTIYTRSEEWYLNPQSGEIYVYLEPDDKILPEWSKVDVFAEPETPKADPKNINTNSLRAIPEGNMNNAACESLKFMLGLLTKNGAVESIADQTPDATLDNRIIETHFRDTRSGLVYRLIENPDDKTTRWERVLHSSKNAMVQ